MASRLPALVLVCLLGSGAAQECIGGECPVSEADDAGLLAVRTEQLQRIRAHARDLKAENEQRGAQSGCPMTVSDVAGFKKCWFSFMACCVASDAPIVGSMAGYSTTPATNRLYLPNRTFAWVFGTEDLESTLALRAKYGSAWYLTYGLQVTVGFNPIQSSFAAPTDPFGFQLMVFEPADRGSMFVPTFAQWFLVFEWKAPDEFKVSFCPKVVNEVLKAYNTLATNRDVVDAWTDLTGCSRECSAADNLPEQVTRKCGCHREVVQLYDHMSNLVYPEPLIGSYECMKKAFDFAKGKWTAGQVRMALHLCTDADPLYTGMGLGFNTLVSPLKQSRLFQGKFSCAYYPWQRMAGREFILPNLDIGVLAKPGYAALNLTAIPLVHDPRVTDPPARLPRNATSDYCLRGSS